jgi:hypothetical protein
MSVEEDYAYAAGLFDGEGCVVFRHRKKTDKQWQMELTLSNCDERALFFMKNIFKGSTRTAVIRREGNRYPFGVWTVSGPSAGYAAKAMLPYSILKRKQLELFLQGRDTVVGRGCHLSAKRKLKRHKLATQIRLLKRPQMAMPV